MADHEAGIGQGVVAKAPDMVFARALGSCVAVILYDPNKKIGGMAHVMLPDSTNARYMDNPYRYADSAVTTLLESICEKGANKFRLKAKAVGGAQLFNADETMEKPIGDQNIAMVKVALHKAGLNLIAEDMGGKRGRNVKFFLDSGKVQVAIIGQQPKEL